MNKKSLIFSFVICFLLAFSLQTFAANVEKNVPEKVYVGLHLLRIPSMSLVDNTFNVDFYVWFRWKDKEISPFKSFEITNGSITNKELQEEKILSDGWHYAVGRAQATITKFWDVHRYPFDSHLLTISIEDSERDTDGQVYTVDEGNCGVDRELLISGWELGEVSNNADLHTYKTNWGDTDLGKDARSVYSRFNFSVMLNRAGISYSFVMLYAVYLSIMVALFTLFIKPINLDPRFGMPVGAIFAIIASQFVTASNLPASAQLTIADKLHIMSGMVILTVIIESVLSLKWFEEGREVQSRWLDRITALVLVVLCVIANLVILFG
ncbi:MAG: hypothetical protein WC890_04395 [Candidatus Margulisiibacteriota bacterium]